MWKGTSLPVASALLSIAAPTGSPVLNDLAKRLLTTAAVPPEGEAEAGASSLMSLRVAKLIAFGAAGEAWRLAKQADAKLIDDQVVHDAAENLLAAGGDDLCPQIPDLMKVRSNADWLKAQVICQLRAKDNAGASVSLDVMRAEPSRDTIFLEIADKNIITTRKNLPFQLTPLTASNLALLNLTALPLPGELYGHPDLALAGALMHTQTKQDVAQLGLAEHAAARGLVSVADLEALYKTVAFTPDEIANPIAAKETGLRLRALYYLAAVTDKDTGRRIGYAIRFVQSAMPAFTNVAGAVAADMMGVVKADPAMHEDAATIAWIYMLAGRGDAALDWVRLARGGSATADDVLKYWPQFVLAGMEAESDYSADFDKWLAATLTPASAQEDPRVTRDAAAGALLLLDAAGFKVPDTAWAKVIAVAHNEKHIAPSPVLLDRMESAGAGGKKAETVLLAVGLAGDGDISLPAAVAITRALRGAGFKGEAALFARQMAVLAVKQN